jgi:uncharacterized membrane protein
MSSSYHDVAGQHVRRIEGLSDGVFAIAMTLLVLELHLPGGEMIADDAGALAALPAFLPKLASYFLGFLTLGLYWVIQSAQLGMMTRSSRTFTWLHIAFLSVISLFPFVTAFLGDHYQLRMAIAIYWLPLFVGGVLLYVAVRHARAYHLIDTERDNGAIIGRIFTAQLLYAGGALLCLIDTRLSIAVIFFTQLKFALGPIGRR